MLEAVEEARGLVNDGKELRQRLLTCPTAKGIRGKLGEQRGDVVFHERGVVACA